MWNAAPPLELFALNQQHSDSSPSCHPDAIFVFKLFEMLVIKRLVTK
jgi:hypothetical protein